MKRFLILVLSLSSFCFGFDHRISLELSGGEDDYSSSFVSGRFGLDPQTNILVSLFQSKIKSDVNGVAQEEVSNEINLGGDYTLPNQLNLNGKLIHRKETDEIKVGGLNIGLSYDIAKWWGGSKSSDVSVNIESLSYSQNSPNQRRVQVGERFRQNSFSLSLMQEIQYWFALSFGFTRYRYSKDPAVLVSAYDNRVLPFPQIEGLLYGFPETSSYLGFNFFLTQKWDLSLTTSKTTTVVDRLESKTFSFSIGYQFTDRLYTYFTASSSKREDINEKLGLASLGLDWRF